MREHFMTTELVFSEEIRVFTANTEKIRKSVSPEPAACNFAKSFKRNDENHREWDFNFRVNGKHPRPITRPNVCQGNNLNVRDHIRESFTIVSIAK